MTQKNKFTLKLKSPSFSKINPCKITRIEIKSDLKWYLKNTLEDREVKSHFSKKSSHQHDF